MSRRLLCLTFIAALAPAAAVASPVQERPGPSATAAAADYRPATKPERRAMKKARVSLADRTGYFVGKIDPKFGIVCGHRRSGDDFQVGAGVRRVHGRWRARRNLSSGELQTYDLFCSER